jgi:hypothetical protein
VLYYTSNMLNTLLPSLVERYERLLESNAKLTKELESMKEKIVAADRVHLAVPLLSFLSLSLSLFFF